MHKIYNYLRKTNLIDIFDIEFDEKNMKFMRKFKSKLMGQLIILSKHYIKAEKDSKVVQDLEFMQDCEDADILKVILNEAHDLKLLDQVQINKPIIKFKLGVTGI
jgi:hypothetical protein